MVTQLSLCVYCGSRMGQSPAFEAIAREVGRQIGDELVAQRRAGYGRADLSGPPSVAEELERLEGMLQRGTLTPEEFAAQKLHEFVGPLPYYLLEWFGNSPAFLSPGWVFWTVCVIEILQWTPFALLLFHLAYSSIPADVREAARMDGARGWRTFRRVELPMLMPTLALAAVIRLIDGIRVFDNIYVLVGAGPGGSTTSLPIYIYTSFFRGGSLGPALAASVPLSSRT